jgi:hypothetical protein
LAFAGLKPGIDLIGFIGTTEVVPCYKALGIDSPMSFSAACEAQCRFAGVTAWMNPCLSKKQHRFKMDGKELPCD